MCATVPNAVHNTPLLPGSTPPTPSPTMGAAHIKDNVVKKKVLFVNVVDAGTRIDTALDGGTL